METRREKQSEQYQALSKEKLKLLNDLVKAREISIKDLADFIGVKNYDLCNVLKGKKTSRITRARINLFIKKTGLTKETVDTIDLTKLIKESTSPMHLEQDHILKIERFMRVQGFSQQDTARLIDVKRTPFQDALLGKKVSFGNRKKIENFVQKKLKKIKAGVEEVGGALTSEDVEQRAERIKYILLTLESDLSFFKDSKEARAFFQREFDLGDVGYISSLLTALCSNEEQFQRWLEFSTNKFGFFKKKG